MRRKYSVEQKNEILRDLEKSGLSAAEYCRRKDLCYSSLRRWNRDLKSGHQSGSLTLVQVGHSQVKLDTDCKITVRVGTKVVVDFSSDFPLESLVLFCREVGRC